MSIMNEWPQGLVKYGAVDASGNHTLFFQGCRLSLGYEVLEVICMLWTLLTVSY